MKFDINEYKGKYAMHCKTEKEARDFCNYLHSVGKRWDNGMSYLDKTEWLIYQSDSVYLFNSDLVGYINYAERNNYTILEWEDFMNKEFTKADLKTGDVVEFRNQTVGVIIPEVGTIILNDGFIKLEDVQEDLTDVSEVNWDIVAVRRPNNAYECQFCTFEFEYGTLVYERKEVEEMTLAEVCKLLGKEIKIVK